MIDHYEIPIDWNLERKGRHPLHNYTFSQCCLHQKAVAWQCDWRACQIGGGVVKCDDCGQSVDTLHINWAGHSICDECLKRVEVVL